MRKLLALAIMVVLILGASLTWSGIPQRISYQGMLTDDVGQPLNGSFELTFRIFNDSTTQNEQWAETQYDIILTEGLFNVNLGDSTPIELAFDEDYWLEIIIDGTDTLAPRLRLTSVGYAYRALIADSAVVVISADSGGGWVDDGAFVRLGDSTNSVGIGTRSPDEKLTLSYDSYIGWEYGLGSSEVGHKIGKSSNGAGPLEFITDFNTGPTEALFSFINQDDSKYILSMLYNGHVGIGNTYPLFDLHVGQSSSTNQRAQIEGLTVIRTNGAGQPTNLRLCNLNGGTNSGASVDFQGLNSGSALENAARISGFLSDQTSASEEGVLSFFTNDAGDDGLAERMRIDEDGNVGIGTDTPQGALDVSSTTGAFIVPRMTTTQRDALTPVNGMIIYNTSTSQFNFYENGSWVTK